MADELPRPVPIDVTRPFWDGLAADEIRLQRCRRLRLVGVLPPAALLDVPVRRLDWHTVSGRGTVYSYTIARQPTHPAFAAEVPQLLAIVELDEGVRMTTTLVDAGARRPPHRPAGRSGVRPRRRRHDPAALRPALIYRFGNCELDVDRVVLRRDGREVQIEPQVFDLLCCLVERRGRLLRKEELLDLVWGDRFVSESALTTRIKSVRQAVGDDGTRQEVIRTVHGKGYEFIADVRGRATRRPSTPARSRRRVDRVAVGAASAWSGGTT